MQKTEKSPKAELTGNWREVLHDESLAHLIKTAFRCTSNGLARRLKQYVVLYGHWTLLRVLWRGDGMTQRQLSEQAGVTEPSTITALKAMELQGYIYRQKVPGNRKQIRVFLTPKGAALRSASVSCADEVNTIAKAGIPPEDLATTRRTLLALIENLSGDALHQAEEKDGAQEVGNGDMA